MTTAVVAAALVAGAWLCVGLAFRGARRAEMRHRVALGREVAPAPVLHVPLRSVLFPALLAGIGFLLWGVLGALAAAAAVPVAGIVRRRKTARSLAAGLDEQIADLTGALSSAVRAGMSVPQSLAYAAGEAGSPLRAELQRLVEDVHVGVPLGDAVAAWSERIGSDDAQLLAAALDLHRRAGGDLPAVLDQVGVAIRDRVAAGREVRSLTAQARLSGLILGLLPIGFFAFLWVTSRRDIEAALSTTAGLVAVALGLTLEAVAFVWIRRLLEVT